MLKNKENCASKMKTKAIFCGLIACNILITKMLTLILKSDNL